eukprot:jgi/Mesvir1/4583/Mv08159-RA.1
MAKLLVWADLSRQQVEHLLRLSAKASDVPMLRKTVDEYMGLDDVQSNHEQAALEDLYFNTIQFAWKLGFTPEKVSAFFSIMKRTHFDAVGGRLTLRKSFAAFQDLLLAHAVQRPPYSVGIFSLHDVQVLTDYAINSYFRHYKLYQYAFTSRFTLSLATIPAVVLQFPPPLRPLSAAVTEEEWQGERHKSEEERKVAQKRQDEELLAQAEVAREAAIRAAYDGGCTPHAHAVIARHTHTPCRSV